MIAVAGNDTMSLANVLTVANQNPASARVPQMDDGHVRPALLDPPCTYPPFFWSVISDHGGPFHATVTTLGRHRKPSVCGHLSREAVCEWRQRTDKSTRRHFTRLRCSDSVSPSALQSPLALSQARWTWQAHPALSGDPLRNKNP